MKVISKRISRNEFVSHKNGVIPSLADMWYIPGMAFRKNGVTAITEVCDNGALKTAFSANTCAPSDAESVNYVFSTYPSAVAKINDLGLSSSLLGYKAEFVYQDHNYGLIVSDIIIPNDIAKDVTDYTDFYVNIPDGNGGYYDLNDKKSFVHYDGRKIISGTTEIKILTYSTLTKWYTFFKKYKETIKPYNKAIDYYNNRYKVKNTVNEKRFAGLDALYASRGGDKMYNWIIENCMPYDVENGSPKDTFTAATNSASYTIPILLSNSIDDLGQMTNFYDKWKSGVDYHNRVGDSFGTVAYYNGKTYMINSSGTKGYEQNEYYENVFRGGDWSNYSGFYIYNHSGEFASHGVDNKCVETYAYSPINGRIIYNPTTSCENEIVPYTKEDFIIYNGEYIKVINGEYVIPSYTEGCYADIYLKKGKMLPVVAEGTLKYAELNGKKFYAVNDKIFFSKRSDCRDNGSAVMKGRYILYNGELFLAVGNSVTFDADETLKVVSTILNGYFVYKGAIFYIFGNKVVVPKLIYSDDGKTLFSAYEDITEDDLKNFGWESVTVNNDGTVTICHTLDIKRADIITGYTDSKLDLLRRRKINVDELGGELPGYLDIFVYKEGDTAYEIKSEELECDDEGKPVKFTAESTPTVALQGSHYNTPYDQCTLDLLYKVGEVSEIEYQKTVKIGGKNVDLFNGNYLESIVFYHLNEDDEKIDVVSVAGEDSRQYLRLYEEPKYSRDGSIIPETLYNGDNVEIGNVGDYYRPEEVLYCDVTYYLDATLVYDEEKYAYVPAEDRNEGIKYVDTLTVVKSSDSFYMSDGTSFEFNYYELRGNMSSETLDDFNDVQLTNMSYFEMKIKRFCGNVEKEFKTDYWEENNGMVVGPVFRTEYDIWSSTPQKLNSNIYIDRGVNAAFEKHLKLSEVHTLDALINYGNGYFKINED